MTGELAQWKLENHQHESVDIGFHLIKLVNDPYAGVWSTVTTNVGFNTSTSYRCQIISLSHPVRKLTTLRHAFSCRFLTIKHVLNQVNPSNNSLCRQLPTCHFPNKQPAQATPKFLQPMEADGDQRSCDLQHHPRKIYPRTKIHLLTG